MKQAFLYYFIVLLIGMADCFAQTPVNQSGIILPTKQVLLDAGFNVSLPAHDDLMRTHTLGMGITARAMAPINEKWNIGIRAEYDYRFAKRNYPDSVLKFTNKHRNYSMMSLKPGMEFNFRPRYFAGLEAGMAYVVLHNDSKTGFGFVEEFDGSTPIGFSMDIYAGKKFNYWHGRKTLAISMYWLFFYAENHGESAIGIRSVYLFRR